MQTTNVRTPEQLERLATEANLRMQQHLEAKGQRKKREAIAQTHKNEEKQKKITEKEQKKTERERKKKEKEEQKEVKRTKMEKTDDEEKKEVKGTKMEKTDDEEKKEVKKKKKGNKKNEETEDESDEEEEEDEGDEEEDQEEPEEEDGFIVAGVNATHLWRNKRYWHCAWMGVQPGTNPPLPWAQSWEPQMKLGVKATEHFKTYQDTHPDWRSEFCQDCEDELEEDYRLHR